MLVAKRERTHERENFRESKGENAIITTLNGIHVTTQMKSGLKQLAEVISIKAA